MITGVEVKKLKLVTDQRGRLAEILRADENIFEKFGQVYITTANPHIVKGWHYHKMQTDYFTCVSGKIKLVLYDSRKDSKTFGRVDEFIMSMDEPMLVKIPPLVYHGFKCISQNEAIMINIPTEPYNHKNPDEYRIDPYDNDISYDWRK